MKNDIGIYFLNGILFALCLWLYTEMDGCQSKHLRSPVPKPPAVDTSKVKIDTTDQKEARFEGDVTFKN